VTTPAATPVTQGTVEALVRKRLGDALGGRRGMLEGAVPTLGFTIGWISSHNLKLSLIIGVGIALVLLAARIAQRQPVQYVVNAIVGISIAAVFALRSGNAADIIIPSLIYNSVYFVLLAGSALVRWPVVGFMIGGVTGDPTGWHADPRIVKLCGRLTWILAIPCALRVAVYYPLWLADQAGWLGVAKLVLGWPLQLAALGAMVWLLSRNHTPLASDGRLQTA
jgi:hypothetical protein